MEPSVSRAIIIIIIIIKNVFYYDGATAITKYMLKSCVTSHKSAYTGGGGECHSEGTVSAEV